IHVGIALWQRRMAWRYLVGLLSIAGVVALLFVNTYAYSFANFLLVQANHGTASTDGQILLFPFYLMPSGMAKLWGLQTLTGPPTSDPWMSAHIVLGCILLIVTFVCALRQVRANYAAASVTLVLYLLGMILYLQAAAFGLFKLAMISQAFLLAS